MTADEKIKEVMELVNCMVSSVTQASHAITEEWREGCLVEARERHKAIEAKLRQIIQ